MHKMEDFEWNVNNECQLLEAMVGHKPVGINKGFQMLLIYDKFAERLEKDLVSEILWNHLKTMYNLEVLEENEAIPFPNNETDFDLPDYDFATLKEVKSEEKKNIQKGRETPKMIKEIFKKDDKTPVRNTKDIQRRDSKDNKHSVTAKKEIKKEAEKTVKVIKSRRSSNTSREETPKSTKNKNEELRTAKRPTRASLKPDETNSGKASPVTVTTPVPVKRRRI